MNEAHWNSKYCQAKVEQLSWYQSAPQPAIDMIRSLRPSAAVAIIDVGAGASNLVDWLVVEGYQNITALDISARALEHSRQRLGKAAGQVDWQVAALETYRTEKRFDIWHDRAVFHFFVAKQQREQYKKVLNTVLRPGGYVLMSTFAIGGAKKCSGLPVVQYDAPQLSQELGERFRLIDTSVEMHITPAASEQLFCHFIFQRID